MLVVEVVYVGRQVVCVGVVVVIIKIRILLFCVCLPECCRLAVILIVPTCFLMFMMMVGRLVGRQVVFSGRILFVLPVFL